MTEQVVLRTREMQRVEARLGKPIEQVLRELYLERGLKLDEVGRELGITKGAVSRWLANFGIETRRGGPQQATEAATA